MANHRKSSRGNAKSTPGRRRQEVYSEPQFILVDRYLTPSMAKKAKREKLNKQDALNKYGKNRYAVNPNAKLVKVIYHTK